MKGKYNGKMLVEKLKIIKEKTKTNISEAYGGQQCQHT